MKPIIGIIGRWGYSKGGHKITIVYDDIINAIINSGGIPIGIDNNYMINYLNMCDGFILQGGDDIDNNNLEILKILNIMDKPVFGICLGMQEMGVYGGGKLIDIDNHLDSGLHEVFIDRDSLLYRIIGKNKILVNSRHKSMIVDSNLFVGSKSIDNVIESIEDKNKKFFLGVQWHPENMYSEDKMI